jgi:hypothetical protein
MRSLATEDHYLQAVIKGKKLKMYIAVGVDPQYSFVTQTRQEISAIRFFSIDQVRSDASFPLCAYVRPFLNKLSTWITSHRARLGERDRDPSRSQSVPQNPRSHSRSNRSKSSRDSLTFNANDDEGRWTAEEMFETNERLFGIRATTLTDSNEMASSMASMQFRQCNLTPSKSLSTPVGNTAPARESSLKNFQLDTGDIMDKLLLGMKS